MKNLNLIDFTQEDVTRILKAHDFSIKEINEQGIIIKCPFHKNREHDILIDKEHQNFHCELKDVKNHWVHMLQYKYPTIKGIINFETALNIAAQILGKKIPSTKRETLTVMKSTLNMYYKMLAEVTRLLNISLINVNDGNANYQPLLSNILLNSLQELKIDKEDIISYNLGFSYSKKYLIPHTGTTEFKKRMGTQKIFPHLLNTGMLQKTVTTTLNHKTKTIYTENIIGKLMFPIYNDNGYVTGHLGIHAKNMLDIEVHPISRKFIEYQDKVFVGLKNGTLVNFDPDADEKTHLKPVGHIKKGHIVIYNLSMPPENGRYVTAIREKFTIPYGISILRDGTEVKYRVQDKQIYNDKGKKVGYVNKNDEAIFPINNNIREYELFHSPVRYQKDLPPCYFYGEFQNKDHITKADELIIVIDPIHLVQLAKTGIRNVIAISLPSLLARPDKNQPKSVSNVKAEIKTETILRSTVLYLKRKYIDKSLTLMIPTTFPEYKDFLFQISREFNLSDVNVINANPTQINKQIGTCEVKTILPFIRQNKQDFRTFFFRQTAQTLEEITGRGIVANLPMFYRHVKQFFPRSTFEQAVADTYKVNIEFVRDLLDNPNTKKIPQNIR